MEFVLLKYLGKVHVLLSVKEHTEVEVLYISCDKFCIQGGNGGVEK